MMMIQQRLLIIVLPLSSICKIEVTFISAALRPQLNFRRCRLECNSQLAALRAALRGATARCKYLVAD